MKILVALVVFVALIRETCDKRMGASRDAVIGQNAHECFALTFAQALALDPRLAKATQVAARSIMTEVELHGQRQVALERMAGD